MNEVYEYVEDDELAEDGVESRMEDDYRKNFDVRMHERPDFGTTKRRSETSTMVVEIPMISYKWLTKPHKMRLLNRGRLPSVWSEEIKDFVGNFGWVMQGYSHVDVKLRQQRLSDTDGGLTPTGRIRVRVKVAMDKITHSSDKEQ